MRITAGARGGEPGFDVVWALVLGIWLRRVARAEFAAAAGHTGQWTGLLPDPGADADVNNLQQNSRVRVAGRDVGNVTKNQPPGLAWRW